MTKPATDDGSSGSATAMLFERCYDELRALASQLMRFERIGHTLTPTAVVHEAYLRFASQRSAGLDLDQTTRFKALAALFLRRTLIDHARRSLAARRGGAAARSAWIETTGLEELPPGRLLELDEALELLGEESPQLARLIELRFFGGLSIDETAVILGISPRTVDSRWRTARAVLRRHLEPPGSGQ